MRYSGPSTYNTTRGGRGAVSESIARLKRCDIASRFFLAPCEQKKKKTSIFLYRRCVCCLMPSGLVGGVWSCVEGDSYGGKGKRVSRTTHVGGWWCEAYARPLPSSLPHSLGLYVIRGLLNSRPFGGEQCAFFRGLVGKKKKEIQWKKHRTLVFFDNVILPENTYTYLLSCRRATSSSSSSCCSVDTALQ